MKRTDQPDPCRSQENPRAYTRFYNNNNNIIIMKILPVLLFSGSLP